MNTSGFLGVVFLSDDIKSPVEPRKSNEISEELNCGDGGRIVGMPPPSVFSSGSSKLKQAIDGKTWILNLVSERS